MDFPTDLIGQLASDLKSNLSLNDLKSPLYGLISLTVNARKFHCFFLYTSKRVRTRVTEVKNYPPNE